MKRNEKRTGVGRGGVGRVIVTLGVGVALSLTTAIASAQGIQESKTDDGYGYSFDDDPLNAGGFGPNDVALRHVQADGAVGGTDQPAGRFDQTRQQWLQFQFRGHVLDHLAQRIEAVAFAEVVVHAAILVMA